MISDDTPIVEEAECCQKCGSDTQVCSLMGIPICRPCYDDEPVFKAWFMAELEKALKDSPEFEQLPDGRWHHVKEL